MDEATRNLTEMRRLLVIAADETREMSASEAVNWTKDFFHREGVLEPAELKQLLSEAKHNDDVQEPYQGQELTLRSSVGAWGNLLAGDAFNLVVASPKAGKSALMVHLFACSKRGDAECLGSPLRKRWNKLIISGSDMSAGEWGKILIREGLAVPTGDDHETFLPDDDVILWDMGNPAKLNPKGIEAMAKKCLEYPNSLLIIDSLRSNAGGLDENKAEIREPIEAAKFGLEGCNVTAVLIHHANKSVFGSSAVTAAAGNNAIVGACDQTLLLKHLKPESVTGFRTDNRLVASSSGRLAPDRLLIELTSDGTGHWVGHGDAEAATLEEHIAEVEEKLSGRQLTAYEHAEEIAANGVHTTSQEIASQLGISAIKANKTINALVRKGLMIRCGETDSHGMGRNRILYAPALSDLARARAKPHENVVSGGPGVTGSDDHIPETPITPITPDNMLFAKKKYSVDYDLNKPVERLLADGSWERGWLLHNGSDPDKVSLVKFGNESYRVHGYRWDHDVRPCESFYSTTTDPSQLDLDSLPF